MSPSNTGYEPVQGDPDDVAKRGPMESSVPGQMPGATKPNWDEARLGRLRSRRKSPVFAGLLSLCPGLGQIYVGHYQRGFTNSVVIAMTIAFLAWAKPVPLDIIGGFFVSFYWLYNIIDAIRLANFYNEALGGASEEELRRGMVLPTGGSLAGGLVLVVVGVLLGMHTLFDVSMDWLNDWWPIVPLGFGVYLIYKGIAERRR
jgi:hypothetical protein